LRRSRALLQLGAGFALAVAALWLTWRNTDRAALSAALSGAHWWLLLLVLPPLGLSYVFRISRWQVLLRPVKPVRFRTAMSPLLAGFMVNSVFPARAGELVRALLLSRRTGVSKAASFGTVFLDRVFDGLTLTAMTLAATATLWSRLETGVRTGLIAASAGYVLVLLFAIALRKWRSRAASASVAPLRWAGLGKVADRLEGVLLSFSEGLATLQNWKEVIQLSALSAGVWLTLAFSVVPAYLALGLPFTWFHPALVIILSAFGMLIPTPAGTGTVHAAITMVLPALTGIGRGEASALAVVFHASQFLPIIVVGLAAAISEGLRPSDVVDADGGPQDPSPAAGG